MARIITRTLADLIAERDALKDKMKAAKEASLARFEAETKGLAEEIKKAEVRVRVFEAMEKAASLGMVNEL